MALFGSMAVAVVGDTSKFNKAMDDAGNKTSSFGDKFGKVASTIGKAAAVGLAAAGTAFVALATKALNAGGELEQNVGGIETMFKSSSDKVIKYAKQAYQTAGLSANSYMEQVTSFSARLLQGLGGNTEKAADIANMAIIDMSDNANKFGTDITNIQNAYQGFAKANYTMLDNLKLGYGGTKTEMERLLTDAEKLTGVKYDIENFDDIIEAIHAVQDNLGVTGTTAKEAMSTLSGSLGTAKAAFTNFLDGSGGVKQLVDSVSNAMNIVVDRLRELLPRLTSGLTEVVKGLMPQVPGIIKDLLPSIVEGASALISGFISIAPKLIDTILGIFPDALKTLASGLGEALPILSPLTGAISFLADNFDKALPVIVSLAAGVTAYNAAIAITEALQKASTAATIADTAAKVTAAFATGGLTSAVAALNAALGINPFVLAVAGLAAFVTALGFVATSLGKANSAQKELLDSSQDLRKENEKLSKSMEESEGAYEDRVKSISGNAEVSRKLTDRVYELAEAENKSEAEKRKLKILVDQLNETMPELNLHYDEEADALSRTRQETYDLIAAKKEEAKQQAISERALEIAKEQIELDEQLRSTREKRIELEQQLADGMITSQSGVRLYERDIRLLAEQEEALTKEIQERELALDSITETMVESSAKQIEAGEAVVEHVKSAQEIQAEIVAAREREETEYTDHLIEQANQWGMTLDEYVNHLEKLQDEENKIAEERAKTLGKYTDLATDMFNKIETKSEISVKDMTANLEANQKAISKWSDNLVTLSKRGVDEGLLATLRDAGPESAATVNELVNASDTELKRLSSVFASGSEVATDALRKQFGLPDVAGAGSKMVDEVSAGVANNNSLTAASEQLIQKAKSAMDSGVSVGGFSSIGANMIQGIINGINSMTSQLYSSIVSVANETVQKAKDALQIRSPSKVFDYIGKMTGQGYVDGIDAMSKKATKAVEALVSAPSAYEASFDSNTLAAQTAMPLHAFARGAAEGDVASLENKASNNPVVIVVKSILDGHEVGYAATEFISQQQGYDLDSALRAAGVMV